MKNLYETLHYFKKINQPTAWGLDVLSTMLSPMKNWTHTHRTMYAGAVWWRDLMKTFPKPEFGFESLHINGVDYKVKTEIKKKKDFCRFVKFSLEGKSRPSILIVAPLSGHYATLLRDTVKRALYDHDVWITDWENASEVPLAKGVFGFHDYVDYVIDAFKEVKKEGEFNVIAVCQPTVPVLAAVAYLEGVGEADALPKSLALLGGPLDTRCSPTQVNEYALNKDLEWFKDNVIFDVPRDLPGAGRRVYPGFMQHAGFVAMNMKKHHQAHVDFFEHLLAGSDLSVEKHQKFYDEYNAVMDLHAEYYLETLENVFFDQKLVKKTMVHRKKILNLGDIRKVKIITVEGELDDISGPGQTHAIHASCTGLLSKQRMKKTFEGVGHYGIFSGKSWREKIYPEIMSFFKQK
jgi:poly(3-hydroxybutyrate) depolymerase